MKSKAGFDSLLPGVTRFVALRWKNMKSCSLGLIVVAVCLKFTKVSESSVNESSNELDSELLAREISNQVELMVNRSNDDPAALVHGSANNEPPNRLAPEQLRLRDLLGRSQLQYIDYKVEYGLRYDPKVIESKHHLPQREPQQLLHLPPFVMHEGDDGNDEEGKSSAPPPLVVAAVAENGTLIAARDNITLSSGDAASNIMRPPTRAEKAFELLGLRLKKLFLNSFEPNSTESRVIQRLKSPLTLFSLFNVIKFENAACVARRDQLATLYGICYHEVECSQLGGVPMDLCAGGFGVCCVFQLGCNDQTTQNISYFQSPGYPTAVRTTLACSFTVALRWNVRQVLLEFIFFEMGPPEEGNCVEDRLIISVQNNYRTYPILCGINSGQHLYLQIDREYSHFLHLTAASNSVEPKAFNIRIIQLSSTEAPEGCLQYYSGVNGYIKSFNYDDQSVVVTRRNPSYLNNLNYAICIKRMPNFCTVTFTNEDENGEDNQFQLINVDEEGISLVRPNTAGVEIYNCPDDFIAINYLRLCGERLNDGSSTEDYSQNSPATDDSGGPIIVPVRSDGEFVGRGFKLMYRQQICTKS